MWQSSSRSASSDARSVAGVAALASVVAAGMLLFNVSDPVPPLKPVCFDSFIYLDAVQPKFDSFFMQWSNVPTGRTFRLQQTHDLIHWIDTYPRNEFTGVPDRNSMWVPELALEPIPPTPENSDDPISPQRLGVFYRAKDVTP